MKRKMIITLFAIFICNCAWGQWTLREAGTLLATEDVRISQTYHKAVILDLPNESKWKAENISLVLNYMHDSKSATLTIYQKEKVIRRYNVNNVELTRMGWRKNNISGCGYFCEGDNLYKIALMENIDYYIIVDNGNS